MTTEAVASFGYKFLMDDAGGTPAELGDVLVITPPGFERSMIDGTHHGSAGGAAEQVPSGVYRVTPIECELHFEEGNGADGVLIAAIVSKELQDFEIHYPQADGSFRKRGGSGYVSNYKPGSMDLEGKQTCNFTLEITGPLGASAVVT